MNADHEMALASIIEVIVENENNVNDDASTIVDNDLEIDLANDSCADSIDFLCYVCSEDDMPANCEIVKCQKCKFSFHDFCTEIKGKNSLVEFYYCKDCREKFDLRILFRKERANLEKKCEKEREYYEVKEIVSHKIETIYRAGTKRVFRKFGVKWRAVRGMFPESISEEPESHLDGCIDLLQAYCIDNGLELSKITPIFGASKVAKANRKNWMNWEQIESAFNWIKSRNHLCEIKVEKFSHFGKDDGIYFFPLAHHIFVFLYYAKENKCFVSDGGNLFNEKKEEIESEYPDIQFFHVPFLNQTKIDHCGSSAVMIANDFAQKYKSKSMPEKLKAPPTIKQLLAKRFHKAKSELDAEYNIGNLLKLNNCRFCNKSFNKKNVRARTMHEQF